MIKGGLSVTKRDEQEAIRSEQFSRGQVEVISMSNSVRIVEKNYRVTEELSGDRQGLGRDQSGFSRLRCRISYLGRMRLGEVATKEGGRTLCMSIECWWGYWENWLGVSGLTEVVLRVEGVCEEYSGFCSTLCLGIF